MESAWGALRRNVLISNRLQTYIPSTYSLQGYLNLGRPQHTVPFINPKKLNHSVKPCASLILGCLLLTSGCVSDRRLSLVDYSSIHPAEPPKLLQGVWAGRHAGGDLFVEILANGSVRTCLDASPYRNQLAGKYADYALYLEDGARIEIESIDAHSVTIYSPPGRPAAHLFLATGDPDAVGCFAGKSTGEGALRSIP